MARPMPRAAGEPLVAPHPVRVPRHVGGDPPTMRHGGRVFDNGTLAMAIFLGTEAMLFAGLISAFLVLRASAPAWPPPGQPRLPVGVTGLNTAVLLVSVWTMQRAARATRRDRRAAMLRWLALTTALGTTFLLVQGTEWVALLGHGLRLSSGPYGATFYTVIGCHGLHVAAAVITLLVLFEWARRASGARQCQSRVEVCRLYWFFVAAVWPVLYVLVYLA
jgi:heme/copper-type cytochrome/quinol oxidase subunit 3